MLTSDEHGNEFRHTGVGTPAPRHTSENAPCHTHRQSRPSSTECRNSLDRDPLRGGMPPDTNTLKVSEMMVQL